MTDTPEKNPYTDEVEPDSISAALTRVQNRFAAVHPQAAKIISGHAALELEVSAVLRRFVQRPEKLPRMSLEHQLGWLRAFVDDPWLDQILDVISAYAALRNAIAHGDTGDALAKVIARLGEKAEQSDVPLGEDPDFGTFAIFLTAALHVGVEDQPGSWGPGS